MQTVLSCFRKFFLPFLSSDTPTTARNASRKEASSGVTGPAQAKGSSSMARIMSRDSSVLFIRSRLTSSRPSRSAVRMDSTWCANPEIRSRPNMPAEPFMVCITRNTADTSSGSWGFSSSSRRLCSSVPSSSSASSRNVSMNRSSAI